MLEQVAFLRLTSQKLPCYPPSPPTSTYVTLLLRKSRVSFSSETIPWEFPMPSFDKCIWDVSYQLCTSGCKTNVQLFSQFLLDLFLGRRVIPSPYSQVSASLFKISQLFVRRGEWSLALGRKAPSAWMAKSEGGHLCCKPYFSRVAVVFLHCCNVIFFLTDQCISSHSLSPCHSANILHSGYAKKYIFFLSRHIASPGKQIFLYLSEHISPC